MNAPDKLSERAAEIWNHTVSENGHLSVADRDVLAVYCESVARHDEACESIAAMSSLVIMSTRDTPMVAPEVRLARDEAQTIRQLAHELKITPLAREEANEAAGKALDEFKKRRDGLSVVNS